MLHCSDLDQHGEGASSTFVALSGLEAPPSLHPAAPGVNYASMFYTMKEA